MDDRDATGPRASLLVGRAELDGVVLAWAETVARVRVRLVTGSVDREVDVARRLEVLKFPDAVTEGRRAPFAFASGRARACTSLSVGLS